MNSIGHSGGSVHLKQWLDRVATGVLVIAALAVTWKVLFGATSGELAPPIENTAVDNWELLSSGGHRDGPANAVVTMVVFTDLECPACRNFHTEVVVPLRAEFDGQVAVVYRHWPLKYHRFAYAAARAAECAAHQGRFHPFVDAVFAGQDSLGLKSFISFARESEVGDMADFTECASDTGPVARVDQDSALVRRIGGSGTPTVVLNGIRWGRPPTREEVAEIIAALNP
ncbi:MAG TPA: thioredoxin domain-containing protein [Gemmatimonadales bacterium]|nr:thioredoxin domain-containing protein [Gemmatimonadales bacterium]